MPAPILSPAPPKVAAHLFRDADGISGGAAPDATGRWTYWRRDSGARRMPAASEADAIAKAKGEA